MNRISRILNLVLIALTHKIQNQQTQSQDNEYFHKLAAHILRKCFKIWITTSQLKIRIQ
ncbi:unnamed protein product [Paramecium sonneborni]|uniref:Uncharacterized protein n=1 Tax=Paramecium sonneborni TaxID=65129 RepID=A0A8S1R3H4_9CILI|nr:unnamed protein product [Paramecium sonneborni]